MERSLSALTPVHNAQSTLAATVHALLEVLPELTRDFEVVIADDGSTDATIEVADELATRYPQVLALRNTNRPGRAGAIRAAAERSRGDLLLLADEGGCFPLGELQRLWHAAQRHDVVIGRLVPESKRPPRRARPPLTAGGAQIFSRKAFASIAHALVDQATLLAELQEQGSTWHEIEVAPPRSAVHRSSLVRRRQGTKSGISERGSCSTPANEGGPKRPKYLARLKDFALGE